MHSATCLRFRRAIALTFIASATFVVTSQQGTGFTAWAAEGDDARQAHCYAVLIGNEKYENVLPLRFTVNDVKQISQTLCQLGDYRDDDILQMVDSASEDSGRQPLCDNIKGKLPGWLKKAGPDDHVVVVFSGHGFLGDDGKLYLAPLDFDVKKPADTGIPLDWLRTQLEGCSAKLKLLAIDACHAGNEKSVDGSVQVCAKDLAAPFEKVSGTVTFASCTSDEKSWIWPEKRQSVFSYWLNQGLKGHADDNGDGAVDIDELYGYVHDNVPYVTRRVFRQDQTPVRFVGPDVPGQPVVIRPRPHKLKGLLDDMAEQLATVIQLKKVEAVGVPEFSVVSGVSLGGEFGWLGDYCAGELEGYLSKRADRAREPFKVVAQDLLHEALAAKGIGPGDLRNKEVIGLEVDKTRPALIRGILRSRLDNKITLQCSLVSVDDLQVLGQAGGSAELSDQETIMLDQSPSRPVPPVLYQPGPPSVDAKPRQSVTDKVTRWLADNSRGHHPYLDREYPYQVRVMVGKEERKRVIRGNRCYVGLRKGEIYRVRVDLAESVDAPVYMQLFVDGRNTLPEPVPPKAAYPEAKVRYLPAQRVNPTNAQAWKLDPEKRRIFGIPGFYSKGGEDARYNEFLVGEAPDTMGPRKQFNDEPGVITAAFYAAAGGSRSVVTELGEDRRGRTGLYRSVKLGNLRGVVQIHYVEADTLEAAENAPTPPPAD